MKVVVFLRERKLGAGQELGGCQQALSVSHQTGDFAGFIGAV